MIRVAIVGLGWWGQHIAACLRQPDTDSKLVLVRGIDARAERLGEVGQRYEIPLGASLEEALEEASIEAMILATPHSMHESQIIACAKAGKHVFCEKPLALSLPSALRAVDACESAGIVLGVGHERRFEPAFAEVKWLIDSGALGTLMHLEANFSHDLLAKLSPTDWRASPRESPIPALSAMGIHLTDVYRYLCGPIEEVFACSVQRCGYWGAGDVLSVQLRFASGLTGYLSTILVTPMFVRFQAFGSTAWVEARGDMHPGEPGTTRVTVSRTGQERSVKELAFVDTVRANLDAFADAVTGRAPYPISREEKLGNIAVMEAIVQSARSGEPIRVPAI